MINIFSVCKNDVFLNAIANFLNKENIAIVGTCKQPTEPQQAVKQFLTTNADIVVMDAHWNNYDFSGADLLKSFLEQDESIKVILVTNCFENIDDLKTLGAKGYFYRNTKGENIFDCIKTVYNGTAYFVPNKVF